MHAYDDLNPDERRQEIVALLAKGLLRLRRRHLGGAPNPDDADSPRQLDFVAPQSVHESAG